MHRDAKAFASFAMASGLRRAAAGLDWRLPAEKEMGSH
jgi:hypothetical protein